MKLLLITSIEEFEKDVKRILKHSGVVSFSLHRVQGFKNNSNGNLQNWFGIDDIPINSLLFTVFVQPQCVDEIAGRINAFNKVRDSKSTIHLASLQIEKTI